LTGHHGPLFIADIFPAALAQGLKDGAPPTFLPFLPTYDTCDEFDALRDYVYAKIDDAYRVSSFSDTPR